MSDKVNIVIQTKAKDDSVEEMFRSLILSQVANLPLEDAKSLAEDFGLTAKHDEDGNLVIYLQTGKPLLKLEK